MTVLSFWRNSSLGICTWIRLQAAMTAVPHHRQTLPPPRHWLLCPSQQLLPSLIPRVLVLTFWEGKAQLEALLQPLCSNVPAATLQQSGARHGVLSSSPCPALPTLALNAHLKSSCLPGVDPHGTKVNMLDRVIGRPRFSQKLFVFWEHTEESAHRCALWALRWWHFSCSPENL